MSPPKTSQDTDEHTSSQASQAGSTPSTLRVYRQTCLFGPAPAPASPSAQQASAKAPPTSDTSGPSGSSSLSSADLQSSLESRLQALLDGSGSTLYALTWKHWDMPSQPPICALRGRVRRTSDSGSGSEPSGWPTPAAQEFEVADVGRMLKRREECKKKGYNGNGFGLSLGMATAAYFWKMGAWPTPNTPNGGRGLPKDTVIQGSTATSKGRKVQLMTHHIAELAGWPTQAGPTRFTVDGRLLTGSSAEMASGGRLSPEHSRWLMGYPPGWASSAPTETPSSLKRRQRSSKRSSEE